MMVQVVGRPSIKELKLKLLHAFLILRTDNMTDNEISIMYHLSKDKDVQRHLQRAIDRERRVGK